MYILYCTGNTELEDNKAAVKWSMALRGVMPLHLRQDPFDEKG
jgi:hypothetical protein